jgi:hypothetical protein
MKAILGILLLITSLTSLAQFPEPTNLDFSYEYIMIDQSGYCAGQWLYGPTYCSHFTWTVPDTISTNSSLDYYKLYYYSYYTQDTSILKTTTNTYFDMQIGIMGEIWVTAVYLNPDGESELSNIILNEDLPISVKENPLQNELNILFDAKNQEIVIINGKDIFEINIFNVQGELLESEKKIKERISINKFQKGLYIIEILLENQEIKRQKIIK